MDALGDVTVAQAIATAAKCHARTAEPLARPVFGEWLVLREVAPPGGRRLRLQMTLTEDVTRAVRGALLHHADDPPPATLSGHSPDGRPLEQPHAAFLALPDVGSHDSSGTLLGAGIVLPRDIHPADRQAVLCAAGRWERSGLRLVLGRTGVAQLDPVLDGDSPGALDPATCPSRRWASVTPVALDHNPGDLSLRDPVAAAQAVRRAQEIVALACERIGLPRPAYVQVMPRSLFAAAPAAQRFMPFPRKGRGFKRLCVHVDMCFDEPVSGPVLLGVGRYFGIGLCRPWGGRMIMSAQNQARSHGAGRAPSEDVDVISCPSARKQPGLHSGGAGVRKASRRPDAPRHGTRPGPCVYRPRAEARG